MPCRPSAFIAPLLLLAAACADHTPTAVPSPALPGAGAALLECRADVRAATMSCAAADPSLPGSVSAAVLGGQGVNVRLRNTNVVYENAVFRTDVTVESLVAQALGTADGVTPSPEGVRVFFHVAPRATRGAGEVTVANPDGEAFFTAAGQDFFRYAGILAPGDTSPPREWRFAMPGSVEAFSFQVLVTGAVAREAGWVAVSPPAPALAVGDTMRLAATVHEVTGRPLAEQNVQWSSSDPSVLAVEEDGTVTALQEGTATVTATGGGRTGSAAVQVGSASGDAVPPTLRSLSFSPARVNVPSSGFRGVEVTAEVHVTDEGAGVKAVSVVFASPRGWAVATCRPSVPASGTRADGMFRCHAHIDRKTEGGTWKVRYVELEDQAGNARIIQTPQLDSAGVQTSLYVRSAGEILTGDYPLAGVNMAPYSVVANGTDSITFTVHVHDMGLGGGVDLVDLPMLSESRESSAYCAPQELIAGTRSAGTLRCRTAFPPGSETGLWYVYSVLIIGENVSYLDSSASFGFDVTPP